jgi:hypothetical protein
MYDVIVDDLGLTDVIVEEGDDVEVIEIQSVVVVGGGGGSGTITIGTTPISGGTPNFLLTAGADGKTVGQLDPATMTISVDQISDFSSAWSVHAHPQLGSSAFFDDTHFALAIHTHTASEISDSTTVGRAVLTAPHAAAARTAIGAGTVTSVGGTGTVSGLTLTGTVTTSGNITLGGTLAVTASDFASQTKNTFLSAPNGTDGVPTFRAIAAADVPTLNQDTTGNAATATALKTARTINGVSFDGTANITITAAPTAHTHAASEISDSTTVGRAVLTAADAAAARTAIGYATAPTSIAALRGWWSASPLSCFTDAGTVLAGDGEAVYRISDLSGLGNHADQATLADRAILRLDARGFWFLDFQSSDFYIVDTFAGSDVFSSPHTFYVVAQPQANGSVNNGMFAGRGAAVNIRPGYGFRSDTGNPCAFRTEAFTQANSRGIGPGTGNVQYVRCAWYSRGSSATTLVWGCRFDGSTAGNTLTSLNGTDVGLRVGGVRGDQARCPIRHLLYFNAVLTPAELDRLDNYFAELEVI